MPLLSDSQPLTEDELGRINPRIRLTPREQLAMREVFARELPSTATAYLFGSRIDLNAAGGDIDLLIHVPGIEFDGELALTTRLQDALMARLGERKIVRSVCCTRISTTRAKRAVSASISIIPSSLRLSASMVSGLTTRR